jgi:PAP2 superfamily
MIWEAVTQAGSIYFYMAILSVLFATGRRRQAVGLSYLFAISALTVAGLKELFATPRPLLHTEPTYGFPSGHTAMSSALASFFIDRKTVFLLAVPLLVGLSRIMLSEHYAIDVAGGLVIGLAEGILLKRIFDSHYESYLRAEEKYRTEALILLYLAFASTFLLSFYTAAYSNYTGLIIGLFTGILMNREPEGPRSIWRGLIALSGFLILLLPIQDTHLTYLTHFLLGAWVSFLGPLTADMLESAGKKN